MQAVRQRTHLLSELCSTCFFREEVNTAYYSSFDSLWHFILEWFCFVNFRPFFAAVYPLIHCYFLPSLPHYFFPQRKKRKKWRQATDANQWTRKRNKTQLTHQPRLPRRRQRTMGQNQVIMRHQKFTFPRAREWAKWAREQTSDRSGGREQSE